MVVMSIEAYSRMKQNVELALDEADDYSEKTQRRLTHENVFGTLRERVNGKVKQ